MTYPQLKLLPSLFFAFVLLQLGCTSEPPAEPSDLTQEVVIPKPVTVTATGGSFALTETTTIYTEGTSADLTQIGQHLADYLSPSTGFGLPVESADQAPGNGHILLRLDETDTELGEEGYELNITEDALTLTAQQPAGLFRGLQTIRQLLPPEIERDSPQETSWKVATGTVRDYPVYEYRGAMLDVARHFFIVDDVKRYIDLIAFYKLNH